MKTNGTKTELLQSKHTHTHMLTHSSVSVSTQQSGRSQETPCPLRLSAAPAHCVVGNVWCKCEKVCVCVGDRVRKQQVPPAPPDPELKPNVTNIPRPLMLITFTLFPPSLKVIRSCDQNQNIYTEAAVIGRP